MPLLPSGLAQWRAALLRLGIVVAVLVGGPVVAILWCTAMPGVSHTGPLPPLTSEQRLVEFNVRRHVTHLAKTIGPRSVESAPKGLVAAAAYLATEFKKMGFEVERQGFVADGTPVENISVRLPGKTRPDEVIVVGAHYDGYANSPAADDNATGIAALLELARLLKTAGTGRTFHFVAFTNEEPPFFKGEGMGSLVWAKAARDQDMHIVAMLSLESLGYYNDRPGSQKYPQPFALLYPDQANFVAFVSNLGSRDLTRRAIGHFRSGTAFPSEGLAAPAFVNGIDFSDQWAFWQQGYPGLMVTDTAPFRNPGYHRQDEKLNSVDTVRLARVTLGLRAVLLGLDGDP